MSQPTFESASSDPNRAPSGSTNVVMQPLNIYTVMLLISFICVLAGTIVLIGELRRWGNFPSESPWDTSSVGTSSTSNVELPPSYLRTEAQV